MKDADPLIERDEVLLEMWRIKDELSASYGHDVHRMFDEMRRTKGTTGHRLVDLSGEAKARREAEMDASE